MAKKMTRVAKLQFNAGQAKPGPELAGLGIDMAGFTREFNEATKKREGVVPVIITAFNDRSFQFVLKTTPTANLLMKAASIEKGSPKAPNEIIGKISKEQLKEIAEYKLPDLNTLSLDSAISMVKGTAKNMGISIEDVSSKEDSI